MRSQISATCMFCCCDGCYDLGRERQTLAIFDGQQLRAEILVQLHLIPLLLSPGGTREDPGRLGVPIVHEIGPHQVVERRETP